MTEIFDFIGKARRGEIGSVIPATGNFVCRKVFFRFCRRHLFFDEWNVMEIQQYWRGLSAQPVWDGRPDRWVVTVSIARVWRLMVASWLLLVVKGLSRASVFDLRNEKK